MKQYPQTQWNNHHHYGLTPSHLYIPPKYSTFKEEIFEYKDISPKTYENVILPKVQQYIKANKVKQTTYKELNDGYDFIVLEYGIKDGESPTLNHLLSLCLYTDVTALCTSFSMTFRAICKYESLSSIKNRNRNYYWMSRYLRETVQLFGSHGHQGLVGPFFSGLSFKLVFPEFQLRLCSPTSTSYHIEVALNFTNDKQ